MISTYITSYFIEKVKIKAEFKINTLQRDKAMLEIPFPPWCYPRLLYEMLIVEKVLAKKSAETRHEDFL